MKEQAQIRLVDKAIVVEVRLRRPCAIRESMAGHWTWAHGCRELSRAGRARWGRSYRSATTVTIISNDRRRTAPPSRYGSGGFEPRSRPTHSPRDHGIITRVLFGMSLARSRITAQGQVSVPAEIRRRLGVAPGSIIEWDAEGDTIVVRRVRRCTSTDIHKALFPDGPPAARSLTELKAGVRAAVKARHARR